MHYSNCKGCKFQKTKCDRKSEISKGISGLGLTQVKFRCVKRVPLYHSGQRVKIGWDMTGEQVALGYYESHFIEFKATVIKELSFNKYLIRIDNGPDETTGEYIAPDCLKGNGYASVSGNKINPIDEEPRKVCVTCDCVKGTDLEAGCALKDFGDHFMENDAPYICLLFEKDKVA